ncbi:MAG: carboxypeptidase-like regulatory domain-containing protein [Lentimicrobiaceae bacterium]|nr:carboxypeptidase-like regulatory domain-containing protein [Lentimicrobiaceae bacterium]MCB9023343.1 carboxypeptidase-like regulatory domain-containing protein [Lentimicrobiaceae bacterium]MCO5265748.1 carboxypeptidase-like regulatory domain-containing protein [Lentimicrobium sp.]HPG32772.1 carboxypeptidase-like regulatory domain-containing protein [Lentimicrobium sp.]
MRLLASCFLLLVLIIPFSKSEAQSYVMISGTVWNLRGEKLVGAHALNKTRQYGTFTDADAHFFLVLAANDSLKVSMVGYKPYFMQIPEGLTAQTYSLNITLLSDTLILNEAVIKPYPLTYREFRQEFITLRLPEEALQKRLMMPDMPFRRKFENPDGGLLLPGPFTMLYNAFSKEAKELKKMAEIRAKDALREQLLAIISREVISNRYNCNTDTDIDDLILQCGITKEYLTETPHYLIARRLHSCGLVWKANLK